MGSTEIWNDLTELSIICGMNQRYAQEMMTCSQLGGTRIDMLVVIATTVCLVLGMGAFFAPERALTIPYTTLKLRLDTSAVIASVFAAIMGIVLIVSPSNKDAHHYSGMFQSWSDLRQDVDSVIVDADAEKPTSGKLDDEYLRRRYRDLLAKKNSLNSREPSPDKKLLDEFLKLEEESRQPIDEAKSIGSKSTTTGSVQSIAAGK